MHRTRLIIKEMEESGLHPASSLYPADIKENYQYIEDQITEAKLKKADVVHFPECALSGYPGTDMMSLENFDWNELHRDDRFRHVSGKKA